MFNLVEVKFDILNRLTAFSKRGLFHTTKWLSEMLFSLKDVDLKMQQITLKVDGISKAEYDTYLVAFSYFKDQEYDRCIYYLKESTSPVCKFLMYYSSYMSLEYKKLCGTTDSNLFASVPDENYIKKMQELCNLMKTAYVSNTLDGFCLYVYGLVLKKLNHDELAINILVQSIHMEKLNWAAWQELSSLIPDRNWVESCTLPNHWMKNFFSTQLLIDLRMHKDALIALKILTTNGFEKLPYLMSLIASCHDNHKNTTCAVSAFKEMNKADPFRLEGMDSFSDVLFMTGSKKSLAALASNATEIDKYRVQTSCIVGNYYSIRKERTKSILSFQRAVKMNPNFVGAWVLLGHEYLEVKSITAAIKCYLKATRINKREHRAWHGLGRSYENLNRFTFALYYYKVAQKLTPHDNCMLIKVGEMYERLDKPTEASKCYIKVRTIDKNDIHAIIRLGKLYERLNDSEQAITIYNDWVKHDTSLDNIIPWKFEFISACIYMIKQHVSNGNIELAKEVNEQLKKVDENEFRDSHVKMTQFIKIKEQNNRKIENLNGQNIREVYPL